MWKGLVKTLDLFPLKHVRVLTNYIFLKKKNNKKNNVSLLENQTPKHDQKHSCGALQVVSQTSIPGRCMFLDIIISASPISPRLSFCTQSGVVWAGLGFIFSPPSSGPSAFNSLTTIHLPTLNITGSWHYSTEVGCKHKLF